jgi:hypothetical protein
MSEDKDSKIGSTETDPDDDTGGFLETDERQSAEIREIFGTTFPQYLKPIEEVVEQILAGKGDAESTKALLAMIASLMEASSRMGFDNVYQLLASLNDHILGLEIDKQEVVDSSRREQILGLILELSDLAEQMGGQGPSSAAEEQTSIFEVLKDVEGIGDLALRRLAAAGVTTVEQIKMARPDEIAAVSGLDIEVVNKIISILSGDQPADKKNETVSAEKPEAADYESEEIESLHNKVIENLKAEVEVESAIEELKAEIRILRSRVSKRRAELISKDESHQCKKKFLKELLARVNSHSMFLEENRRKRDSLARKCASSEQVVQQHEIRLEAYRKEQRSLEKKAAKLERAVDELVGLLGPIKLSVAKGRSGK